MTALKQGIANHDQLIQSDNYVNANPELKRLITINMIKLKLSLKVQVKVLYLHQMKSIMH